MTPVDQTILDDGRGNCFAACLASLLGLPVAEVPNFVERDDMFGSADEWLRGRGLQLLSLCFPDELALSRTYFDGPLRHCIYSGVSPRKRADGGRKYHAVVGVTSGWGVSVAHDPHPSRAGLAEDGYRWVRFIVPLGV